MEKTIKKFEATLKLSGNKYSAKATKAFFDEWKENKVALKEQGWSLFKYEDKWYMSLTIDPDRASKSYLYSTLCNALKEKCEKHRIGSEESYFDFGQYHISLQNDLGTVRGEIATGGTYRYEYGHDLYINRVDGLTKAEVDAKVKVVLADIETKQKDVAHFVSLDAEGQLRILHPDWTIWERPELAK